MKLSTVSPLLASIRSELARSIAGQSPLVDALLLSLLSEGHILLEGPPGVGKTLAATSFALVLGIDSQRISFTADLMPSDLIGAQWYHPGKGTFSVQKGPVHTQLLVADEINRAPARVQSALLEAMNERAITIATERFVLERPFLVVATQNSLDHEGTYPLPDAQLDRFTISYQAPYMSLEDEARMLLMPSSQTQSVLEQGILPEIIDAVQTEVVVSPEIARYIAVIVNATRQGPLAKWLKWGLSPRTSLALMRVARAQAALQGRDCVFPEDVSKSISLVVRHRLNLSYEAQREGVTREWIIERLQEKTWWAVGRGV